MILNIKGSNRRTRKLVDRATWWYAEKLMGKRLMSGLEIYIKLRKNLITKEGCEGTANIENTTNTRPKEFIIELDVTFSIRDILITLAHEMVHLYQMQVWKDPYSNHNSNFYSWRNYFKQHGLRLYQ